MGEEERARGKRFEIDLRFSLPLKRARAVLLLSHQSVEEGGGGGSKPAISLPFSIDLSDALPSSHNERRRRSDLILLVILALPSVLCLYDTSAVVPRLCLPYPSRYPLWSASNRTRSSLIERTNSSYIGAA